ncbi:SURF1 family protein [Pseudoroseicyclus sp. H15]
MRRIAIPLLFGIAGFAVLVALGVWQLQRMEWKTALLAEIGAQIAAAPTPLPAPGETMAEFAPVEVTGEITGPALRFIYSGSEEDIVAAVETDDGRRVMVDLGLAEARPLSSAAPPLPEGPVTITGNIATPAGKGGPLRLDQSNAWSARQMDGLAEALEAEPLFIVARAAEPPLPGLTPLPVTTENIPNNHFGYAIQWFGMALVWAGMTIYLLRRTLRAKD